MLLKHFPIRVNRRTLYCWALLCFPAKPVPFTSENRFWLSFSGEAQRRGSSHDGVTSQRQQLQLRLFLLVVLLLLIWLQWLWLQVKRTSGRHRKWFLHGCGPPYTRVVFRASWSQELCAYCLLQCKKKKCIYCVGWFFFFYKEDFYQKAHNGKLRWECVFITTFLSWPKWLVVLFCFHFIYFSLHCFKYQGQYLDVIMSNQNMHEGL